MSKSKIEWTDATWNPIRRSVTQNGQAKFAGHFCVKLSSGCTNCYAERMQPRFGHPVRYAAQEQKNVEIYLDEKELLAPLRWRKPRMIFVGSMTDIFGDWVSDEWLDKLYAVMALCPQHTFQVLTKRAKRMREYLSDRIKEDGDHILIAAGIIALINPKLVNALDDITDSTAPWLPLPNVWHGVSVEDQPTANERIPKLRRTPSAIRFISVEPLLGAVDLRRWMATAQVQCKACCTSFWLHDSEPCEHKHYGHGDWTLGCPNCGVCKCVPYQEDRGSITTWGPPSKWVTKYVGRFNKVHPTIIVSSLIDWIIVGGESGPKARPMHPKWEASIRKQCAAANVAYFRKQWGAWLAWDQFGSNGIDDGHEQTKFKTVAWDGEKFIDVGRPMWMEVDHEALYLGRVGKKAAGNLLDGVKHDAMPPKGTSKRAQR